MLSLLLQNTECQFRICECMAEKICCCLTVSGIKLGLVEIGGIQGRRQRILKAGAEGVLDH